MDNPLTGYSRNKAPADRGVALGVSRGHAPPPPLGPDVESTRRGVSPQGAQLFSTTKRNVAS